MVAEATYVYRIIGYRCRYKANMARNRLVSAMDGYGLKTAKMPSSIVKTARGWVRSRIERPPTYITRCSQKTARKKARNESNISIKKYHHSPTLGVKSDKVS